jgi:hypothetical protein
MRERTANHDTSAASSMHTTGATSVSSSVFLSAVSPCGLLRTKRYASNVTNCRA